MKQIINLAIIALLASMLISCAGSAPKAKLNAVKKSFIFVTAENPPFEYINIDDEFDGVDVKIIQEAAKVADVQVMFKLMQYDECVNMVKSGMADGMFSISYSKEQEEFLRFPKTNLSAEKSVIYTNPDFKKEIASISDLSGTMIGVVEGFAYTPEFDNFKECQKTKFKSTSELVKGFLDGKVPMMICSEKPAKYYLDLYKAMYADKRVLISQIITQPLNLGIEPLYLAISKASTKSDDAFRTFSDALMILQENGEMVKIKKKYLK